MSKKANQQSPKTSQAINSENNFNGKYYQAISRRKESTATVRLYPQAEQAVIIINGKKLSEYFPVWEDQEIVLEPLKLTNVLNKFAISAKTRGGGITGQKEAVRLGIARALVLYNPEFKSELKKEGLLKRDPRVVERKKYGLHKARRGLQWRKR